MRLPAPAPLSRLAILLPLIATLPGAGGPARPADPLRDEVVPFLNAYCVRCHDAKTKRGELDLTRFTAAPRITDDFRQWEHVIGFLKKEEMPPAKEKQPTPAARAAVVAALERALLAEARKLDGDPGVVPPRRLSNAEYDNTIHDLTGVDIRPARSFPVDPASGEGFNNTGEALIMSPSLFKKYYAAAEHVAEHAVLTTEGLRFAPHPAVTFADRQKYYEQQILRFYEKHAVDPAAYLALLWKYKNRAGISPPLATWARAEGLSPRYAQLLWDALEGPTKDEHHLRWLRDRWAKFPIRGDVTGAARALADDAMKRGRDLCVPETPAIVANAGNGPVEHLERRRRTAEGRDQFDRGSLAGCATRLELSVGERPGRVTFDVTGEGTVVVEGNWTSNVRGRRKGTLRELLPASSPGDRVTLKAPTRFEVDLPPAAFTGKGNLTLHLTTRLDPATPGVATLRINNGPARVLIDPRHPKAAAYGASAAAFCRLFPNRFFHTDGTRGLSAGFHLIEGFFRDDVPLCRSVLSADELKELDRLWRELYFVTNIWEKMLRGFVFFERSERNFLKHADFDPFREEDPDLITDETLARFQEVYLRRSRVTLTGDALARHPVTVFFTDVRNGLRQRAALLKKAEARYRDDLLAFAERAFRRPLTDAERARLTAFYDGVCRDRDHGVEAAVRATIIRTLVSPHFGMRFTAAPAGDTVAPLPDLALASRLSYFLWASPPDAELLALAKADKLRDPETLRTQVRRMARDPKVSRFALEFFGQWLGYRDFPTRDTVNRAAFPAFDDALKQAMFEEPTRLITHLIREGRPITELLNGDTTFVNGRLARHYGLPTSGQDWKPVTGLRAKGRGGLLGMAVFLTANSQPQRTSPVKRGFWVVHKVLGEHIPPPPPDVAVLPAKETDTKGKTIRQLLKLHVEDVKCARCHQRFDPVGLAMEGFDAIGSARSRDLAGRPVDDAVTLPDGKEARGVPAFADHLATHRKADFTRTLCQKLLGYALGRSLQLSDQPLLERMQADLEKSDHQLSALFETVAGSPPFRDQRCKDFTPSRFRAATPSGGKR